MVEVRLLGPVEARSKGERLRIRGPRQERLLVGLALEHGGVVSEDRLAEIVWPTDDETPSDPTNALQTNISRLRSAGVPVERVRGGYALGADVAVDAVAFVGGVRAAEACATRGDLDAAVAANDDALGLWRSDDLSGWADGGPLRVEGARLLELRHGAIERLGLHLSETGEPDRAIAELYRLVGMAPFRESAVAALMRVLHAAGRQAESLRVFGEYRRDLAQQAGLEPSTALREMERQILADEVESATRPPTRLGSYELGDRIGEGAFGTIYRATQPAVGREVAIKVVRAELANDPEFVRRFEVEAQTIARLEHPHIVPLYDFWREPGGAYLVMRYLAGGSAAGRLVRHGAARLDDVVRLVEEIGPALAVAHGEGVVHRDVKPENILFDEAGNSYLADFGIATDAGVSDLDLRSAGSPLYVSPEQVRDGESSIRSDIYAFGIVLYELLTGVAPFGDAGSIEAVLQRKLAEQVPSVSVLRPELPTAVDLVVQTATALDPTQRFASMGELVLAFRAAAGGVADATSTTDVARPREEAARTLVSLQLESTNPYRGLEAFGEADAEVFFGRDRLVAELEDAVRDSRLVVVTGPSGSGKSSVVRAGLLPRLRSAGTYVASFAPGARPFEELELALQRVAVEPVGPLLDQLEANERALGRIARRVLPTDDARLLLVIDQLEELFTVTDEQTRRRFLDAVADAVTDERGRVSVLATLRADFYDRPLGDPRIAELVRANTVGVPALGHDELVAAITQPAARVGVGVEQRLVTALLADVGEHGAGLPLLQFVLTELFDRRASGQMTLDAYRGIGGLVGALAKRADESFEDRGADGQQQIRSLFRRLVVPGEGSEDTRRRVRRSELAGVSADVVDSLAQARLLTLDHDPATREPTVEVAHEAILREWPRLRTWLDEDRDGLRLIRHLHGAAEAWLDSGRDEGELYRGARLDAVDDWTSAHRSELTSDEQEFLEASLARRDLDSARKAARNRRLRVLATAAAVVAVVAVVAGVIALQQRSRAHQQTELARSNEAAAVEAQQDAENALSGLEQANGALQEQTEVAQRRAFESETGRLAGRAAQVAVDQAQLGLLLALEAHRREPTLETLSALQRSLVDAGSLVTVLGAGDRFDAAFWIDAQRLLSAGSSGIEIFDVTSGERTELVADPVATHQSANVQYIAQEHGIVAHDHELVAFVTEAEPEVLRVVNVETNEDLSAVRLPNRPESLEIGPGGRLVAAISPAGELSMIDVTSGEVIWTVPAVPEVLFSEFDLPDGVEVFWSIEEQAVHTWRIPVRFSPDGETVTTYTAEIRTFDVANGSLISRSSPGPTALLALDVLPATDGESYVTGSGTRYSLRDSETNEALRGGPIEGAANSAGGAVFASGAWDGVSDTAYVLFSNGLLVPFELQDGSVAGPAVRIGQVSADHLAVSPDGTLAAVSSDEGIVVMALDGTRPMTRSLPAGPSFGGGLSRDGRLLVQSIPTLPGFGIDGTDEIYDTSTGVLVQEFSKPGRELAFEPGSDALLATQTFPAERTIEAELQLFDSATLTPLGPVVRTPSGRVTSSLSADRQLFAVATFFHGVHIYDVPNGKLATVLDPRSTDAAFQPDAGDRSSALSFHPDRSVLAVVDNRGDLRIWSTTDWARVTDLSSPTGRRVAGARFTPDGDHLVVVDVVGQVTLLDSANYRAVRALRSAGRRTADAQMAFNSEGRYMLLLAGPSVTLWDLEAGGQIGDAFPNDTDNKIGIQDGDEFPQLVTREGASRLIWDLDVGQWPSIGCRAAGRNLTDAEWTAFGPEDSDLYQTCALWPMS